MLRLRRIEIKNFVCFDDIVIEPSVDPERPLTVVRAENGSGKTTFLRAIRWGMYGDRGLPGEAGRYSLHPAWWQPSDHGIVTKVAMEFETDGSTRYAAEGGAMSRVYHLVRSVRTIGKPVSRSSEPDFRRVSEKAQLMVREGDGEWSPNAAGVSAVVDQLLPWGLRDFFVMDADEAADFVGGSENKVIRQKDVIAKTTAAVDSLLGIRVFRDASQRVAGVARAFGAQATRAIGDADLNALQQEVDELRAERSELLTTMTDQRGQKAEMEDRLRTRQDDLEAELKDIGAVDALRERLVHVDIISMTYKEIGICGLESPSLGLTKEARNAQIQPVRHRVDPQGTECAGGQNPSIYVTVSRRDTRQDRAAGRRGTREQGDRRAPRHAPACREQVAKALLPRTTRTREWRRSPAGFFPLGWSLRSREGVRRTGDEGHRGCRPECAPAGSRRVEGGAQRATDDDDGSAGPES